MKSQNSFYWNNNFTSQRNGLNIFVTIHRIKTHHLLESGSEAKNMKQLNAYLPKKNLVFTLAAYFKL